MHVPPCINLKFNVTTTDITICSRSFHVITSVWGKSRFERPPIYLHMGLRDEEGDCQGYFGQRTRVCDLVCCLTLGFDILIVVVLSPRWIWAIPAPASPLIPAPPDQHCKCHLFKCKCCVLCFRPGTYAPAPCPARNETLTVILSSVHITDFICRCRGHNHMKSTQAHMGQIHSSRVEGL